MDPVQELVEIEKIKRLRARYWRCLDTKDWDGWMNVFTEDCTLTIDNAVSTEGRDGDTQPPICGRRAMRDAVSGMLKDCVTVHKGRSPEIDIVSETEATGIWQQEDLNDYPNRFVHGHGHYYDTYRKEGGQWLISSVRLVRLRIRDTHYQRNF